MVSLGAVVISRNDNYGGDLVNKFRFTLTSLINNLDEVYYIDWNSPEKSLFEEVRRFIPRTGKLRVIVVTPEMAKVLTNNDPDVQFCVEVLARNIGIRRLMTDYIISTNSDIMVFTRDNILNGIVDFNTFHTIARTEIDFHDIEHFTPGSQELTDYIIHNLARWKQHAAGSPLGPRDKWSLITCPGDFQMAHRNVWYTIKGFDEDLVYRGYTDSNVQRKADYYQFNQALVRDIKALHFGHYPGSGSTGGNSAKWNSEECLFNYQGTKNLDTWGFSHIDFEEEIW